MKLLNREPRVRALLPVPALLQAVQYYPKKQGIECGPQPQAKLHANSAVTLSRTHALTHSRTHALTPQQNSPTGGPLSPWGLLIITRCGNFMFFCLFFQKNGFLVHFQSFELKLASIGASNFFLFELVANCC
jgi:hypothetical protein